MYSVDGTTVTYVNDIYADSGTTALSSTVNTAVFSPDGHSLVLGGGFTGRAKVYSVDGTTVTYVSDIYADAGTTALSSTVNTAVFSPDGSALVLVGSFTGRAKVYSVNGTTITYVSDIYANTGTTALSGTVYTSVFSPSGSALVLGGYFPGGAKVYSVDGTTVTYVSDIYADAGTTVLSSKVNTAAFSPDGHSLVLGGIFTGRAKVYSIDGTTVTYVDDIYGGAETTTLNGAVNTAAFSPDGHSLVLGGIFTGRAKVYSVDGTTATYVSNICADTGTTALDGAVNTAVFSPDGHTLVLGGIFTGRAKIYSVDGTTVTYVNDIYADSGTTALNGTVNTVRFSPDGHTIILCGEFTGRAKVYYVSGTTVTYVNDIYDVDNEQALDTVVLTTVSPDGNVLVLAESEYAKIYSVNDGVITYICDIQDGAGNTKFDGNIKSMVFSPDGSTLIIGGAFTGHAKVYSVSGTNVTYTGDLNYRIRKENAKCGLAVFSPSGDTLVLAGDSYAKVYSFDSSGVITYVSDLYADADNSALDGAVLDAAFSSDGKNLVLGGEFAGYAKVYSVDGNVITYISDIYADRHNTALNGAVSIVSLSKFQSSSEYIGETLVLCGLFSGGAKTYFRLSGNDTFRYSYDIYADEHYTLLNADVRMATFSPNGEILLIGGGSSGDKYGYTRVYNLDRLSPDAVYAIGPISDIGHSSTSASFSPDGKTLILDGNSNNNVEIYSVSNTTFTHIGDINVSDYVRFYTKIVFSLDGSMLAITTKYSTNVYSVDDSTFTLIGTIERTNRNGYPMELYSADFSPDGSTLLVTAKDCVKVYSIDGTTIVHADTIYANVVTEEALSGTVTTVVFSPDGHTLVLGGYFTGYAKVYSIDGTTATYVSNICADTGTTALDGTVDTAVFSPDGSALVLGGIFTGRAKIYSVDGTTVTYVNDIYADSGTTALNGTVNTAVFSPDGSALVLVGSFTGRAKVYSVNGTTITYVSDIYANTGTTALSGTVNTAVFSPSGSALVLGGYFPGGAKVYSVDGTTVTYVSDIYADAGTTVLSSKVNTAAFSPNGSALVLGGYFTGRAKVYSVDGTTVTYVNNIYDSVGTKTLNGTVNTAAFSPNGSTLVLGGIFTGYAKVYSVDGTTVTYVSDIYADAGTTALSRKVNTAAFSPNGHTLVLGGIFTGYAKVYSVDGTTVTYVSDIYANTGTTALSGTVTTAVFSPDGHSLILGGGFKNFGIIYQVDNNTIRYEDRTLAYLAPNGIIKNNYSSFSIGFSKSNIGVWANGTVYTIADVITK